MARTDYEIFELGGHEVKLSNPDKVYFPRAGVTKGQLAHYYVETASPSACSRPATATSGARPRIHPARSGCPR